VDHSEGKGGERVMAILNFHGGSCDRTPPSKSRDLSHKIISGDSRRSKNAQTHR
jgi:hypothetical protein